MLFGEETQDIEKGTACLRRKIDAKAKPVGSLGDLEEVALRIGLIQQSLSPQLVRPTVLVFAGDHGLCDEGVSAFPSEVTAQMVENFLAGRACINSFCRAQGMDFWVVDAGVRRDFASHSRLLSQKVRAGTRNMLHEPALTVGEARQCFDKGAEAVELCYAKGSNVLGFGEMGIGNTSVASLWMHVLTRLPLSDCVGFGTGIGSLEHKKAVLAEVVKRHGYAKDLWCCMANYGGLELFQLCGAMVRAAHRRMVLLIDGFVSSAAYLLAQKFCPSVKDYAFFSHLSSEHGHKKLLEHVRGRALLQLNLRLGEGTGTALAYPLLKAAVGFLNEMATFEEARVSTKRKD